MHSVNNGLSTMNNADTSEIALEKIRNILISFEKKKRNLEKRKNKLEEYKKKADLNEDQQSAVSKYPEVLSNLELLEELTTHAVQQLKDAEKSIKKVKKQEKIDKRRCDSQLTEFILRNYAIIDRIGSNERLRRKLVYEGLLSEREIDGVMDLFTEMHLSEKGDWKHCSEQLYSLFDLSIKNPETKVSRDELLSHVSSLAKVEWLWHDSVAEDHQSTVSVPMCSEPHKDTPAVVSVVEEVVLRDEVSMLPPQSSVVIEQQPIVHEERLPAQRPTSDSSKPSFVFLHDSTVHDSSEVRPSSPDCGSTWQTEPSTVVASETTETDDVFSSATQSQFMQNAWAKGARVAPLNGGARFKGHTNAAASFNPENGQTNYEANCWRGGRGSFNNARYARSTRGRGRGGRQDYRSTNDLLPSQ